METPDGPRAETQLETWEEVYKRGLLSFWLLLALHSERRYPYELPAVIEQISQGTMTVNGNSIYRSLRKFEELGLVNSQLEPSESGPDRRYYALTETGLELLRAFIRRNILVFESEPVSRQIGAVLLSS